MTYKEMRESENCTCYSASGLCGKDVHDIIIKGKIVHTELKECSFDRGERCMFYDSQPALYHIDYLNKL